MIVDDEARPRITVGAAGGGDPLASRVTDAGRLVSAQIHETLVEVDCTGSVVAGLADEWSTDDGRTWHFRIARGAVFADGQPVNARSIMEAWAAARVQSLTGVTAVGEYELRVTLNAAADARHFALPALAAARRVAGTWPVGTGPYMADSDAAGGVLRLLARAVGRGRPDTIDVRTFTGDPRTALDAGVDALVTADAATIAYARARSDYTTTPMPWSRTYVIATPSMTAGAAASSPRVAPGPEDLSSLARDAVPGDARPALPPFGWQECAGAAPGRSRGAGYPRQIIHARGDAAGTAIAERLAALAWPRERTPEWLRDHLREYDSPPRTRAVRDSELIDALRSRSALAIITSLPRTAVAGCTRNGTDTPDEMSAMLSGWQVTPLVDTREYLIHRAGTGRIVVDGSGTMRFGRR